MSVEIDVHTVITRPRDVVARFASDPANDTRWIGGLIEASLVGDGPLVAGSEVSRVSRFLGRRMDYRVRILAHEPGALVDMYTTAGPFPMTVRYEFSDVPGGTRMRILTTGDPKGFYKLTGGLLSMAVKRQISSDLEALRVLLEARTDAESAAAH